MAGSHSLWLRTSSVGGKETGEGSNGQASLGDATDMYG